MEAIRPLSNRRSAKCVSRTTHRRTAFVDEPQINGAESVFLRHRNGATHRLAAARLVPDVGRAAAPAGRPDPIATDRRWPPVAALGQLEAKRSADRIGFGK